MVIISYCQSACQLSSLLSHLHSIFLYLYLKQMLFPQSSFVGGDDAECEQQANEDFFAVACLELELMHEGCGLRGLYVHVNRLNVADQLLAQLGM